MYRFIVATGVVAGLLLMSSPIGNAWADSTHVCQGNACNGGGASSNSSSNATATGAGIGVGGGAKVKNTFAPSNTNVGVNTQRQGQAQGQGQSQGQNNQQTIAPYQGQDNYQGTHVDASTSYDRYAPSVAAPALTAAGTGVCLGSVSIGLSGPMAGASFGITKVDKGCERRSGAALLYQMGYKDAALKLLSNDLEIREALGDAAPKAAIKPAATEPLQAASTNFGRVDGN